MVNLDSTLRFYVLEMQHDSYSVYNHNTDKEIYFDADLETVLSFLKFNNPSHPMYVKHVSEACSFENPLAGSFSYTPEDEERNLYYFTASQDQFFNWDTAQQTQDQHKFTTENYNQSNHTKLNNQLEFDFVGSKKTNKDNPQHQIQEEEFKELPEDE